MLVYVETSAYRDREIGVLNLSVRNLETAIYPYA